MRRANSWVLLLVFAMNIVIVMAVVLFATRGIHHTAVFVGIVAVLLLAYLGGRQARTQLRSRRDDRQRPYSSGQNSRK